MRFFAEVEVPDVTERREVEAVRGSLVRAIMGATLRGLDEPADAPYRRPSEIRVQSELDRAWAAEVAGHRPR